MRCVNKCVNCVRHPATMLIQPRCSDTLPKATDYSVPKRQHFAECHLIQASHTPLHSVLSSVSLPHYSSSIFKREYALLQLVCLGPICHAHYSRPHPPALFSLFLSPCSSLSFYLCCAFVTNSGAWRHKGLRTSWGIRHIYLDHMWQRRKRQAEILNDPVKDRAKRGQTGKYDETNFPFLYYLNDQGGILGNLNSCCKWEWKLNTSTQMQRAEPVFIWDESMEDRCLLSQPFLL